MKTLFSVKEYSNGKVEVEMKRGHKEIVCCGYYLLLNRTKNECDRCSKTYDIDGNLITRATEEKRCQK